MYIVKLCFWLSVYLICFILFSLNTLISIFCFILIIINACLLLLQLNVEYLTFLILLLYLGGIIIFFLFTTLMLDNEYDNNKKTNIFLSLDNIFVFLTASKIFFLLNNLNKNILLYIIERQNILTPFTVTGQEVSWNNFLCNHNDIILFISLYSEKYLFLVVLGLILLFTMMAVITITKTKYE